MVSVYNDADELLVSYFVITSAVMWWVMWQTKMHDIFVKQNASGTGFQSVNECGSCTSHYLVTFIRAGLTIRGAQYQGPFLIHVPRIFSLCAFKRSNVCGKKNRQLNGDPLTAGGAPSHGITGTMDNPALTPLSTWQMMSSFLLTADDVSFDQPTTEQPSFLRHRTVLATETFLLPDLESGTICHRNCDTRLSALDNLDTLWNRIFLGFSQPRRIVTFWLLRHRTSLTYLLTYLKLQDATCTTMDVIPSGKQDANRTANYSVFQVLRCRVATCLTCIWSRLFYCF